jgi:carbamoyltransferase
LTNHHRDVAASLQLATEQAIAHLVGSVRELAPSRNLVLVGGVVSNSVAVGRTTADGRFDRVFVPPATGDNGTAYGAAYHVYCRVLRRPRRFVLEHAAWGPAHSAQSAERAARSAGLAVRKLPRAALIEHVVSSLALGNVVGWFQGRMELGARALGNRSLLADPRRRDMRDIINTKIKFRESFRPFAPSVLCERVGDYFEPGVESPFMERVLRVREDRRDEIPAVVHVDGSCRVQTVTRKANALYYDLIRAFGERTGTPVLLNTSLNEGEPIVNTPEQAIACFSRTAMDLLVIGNLVLNRSAAAGGS